MTGQTVQTQVGPLSLTRLVQRGGQGTVYETNKRSCLIKVWDATSVTSPLFPGACEDVRRRYRTFARMNFGTDAELASLPQEDLDIDGCPAYLMMRAPGVEMAAGWQNLIQLDRLARLRIALSLANAFRVLHSRGVVHADPKRDNFFYDPETYFVSVLDIDGGGFDGDSSDHFPPNVGTNPLYVAPEIFNGASHYPDDAARSWQSLWQSPTRRKEPDLWGLAVLIYCIVVDREGPFAKKCFGPRGVATAFTSRTDWPHAEQVRQFEELGLGKLLDPFTSVFRADHRTNADCQRPTALHWSMFLEAALDPTASRRRARPPTPLVAVPNVVGQHEGVARSRLTTLGLTPRDGTGAEHTANAAGVVVSQYPATDTLVPSGSEVEFIVNRRASPVARRQSCFARVTGFLAFLVAVTVAGLTGNSITGRIGIEATEFGPASDWLRILDLETSIAQVQTAAIDAVAYGELNTAAAKASLDVRRVFGSLRWEDCDVATKPSIVPISAAPSHPSMMRQDIDLRLAESEQRFAEAAQNAAPLSWQIQLAREVVALRTLRCVGEAGVRETAALTETVIEEMAKTVMYSQVILDGLRGKVDDAVIAKIAEVQGAFLEGASLIHAVTTGAVFDRVQQFRAPTSKVRFRDVAYSVLADKMPPKLNQGRR